MACKDTRTRYQGVFARHQAGCGMERGKACGCKPRYYGVAWDPNEKRQLKTRRFNKAIEARDARADLIEAIGKGILAPPPSKRLNLRAARQQFLKGVHEGVVLNKWGRRYKPRSFGNLESSLNHLPESMLRRPIEEVKRGDV